MKRLFTSRCDLEIHKVPNSHVDFWFVSIDNLSVAFECVQMCESPSSDEFDTDGESSCLEAIDQNPLFLSSQTHTYTNTHTTTVLLSSTLSLSLCLLLPLSESISISHTHSFCSRQTKQPAIMKWHCIITNTAVYLNELERKQALSLLCFLII